MIAISCTADCTADCTYSNFDDTEMGKWTELHSCCNYFLLNRHFSLLNDFKVPQKNHSFLWLNISCHCDKFLIDMTHWLPSKLCIHSFFLVSKSKNKCFLLFASVASKESQRNHVTKSNELVCLLGVNGRKAAKDMVRLDNSLTLILFQSSYFVKKKNGTPMQGLVILFSNQTFS